MSSSEADSKSVNSDTEYPDHVHECLKYVPIYKKGTFSCSSADDDDDDDDDEDVKRILAEYGQSETEDCKTVGFSSAYKASAAETYLQWTADGLQSAQTADDPADYKDWDEALKDACTAYPPLGVSPAAFEMETRRLDDETLDFRAAKIADGEDGRRLSVGPSSSAQELRKCLEGALYGRDVTDFVVSQPFCVANKNLDFGKPVMSHKAMQDSRKKVENWMSKYAE